MDIQFLTVELTVRKTLCSEKWDPKSPTSNSTVSLSNTSEIENRTKLPNIDETRNFDAFTFWLPNAAFAQSRNIGTTTDKHHTTTTMSARNIGLNKRPSTRAVRKKRGNGQPPSSSERRRTAPYLFPFGDGVDDGDEGPKVCAAGLAGAGTVNASETIVDIVNSRISRLVGVGKKKHSVPGTLASADGTENDDDAGSDAKKVGFLALFSFSTVNERWWMALGTIFAIISGLAMPTWLLLLAKSLETFNNIGKLIASGADPSILVDQIYQLIYSFAVVGGVTLVSGMYSETFAYFFRGLIIMYSYLLCWSSKLRSTNQLL
jgi:hypothetical protein